MIEIGKFNTLKVVKRSEFGMLLDGGRLGSLLLPRRHVPDGCRPGDDLEVFICYDSEDRLVATTQRPLVTVGEIAALKVRAVENVGAFLDWGLDKDLFLPYAEQTRTLKPGYTVAVFVYLDKSHRLAASMRLDRHITKFTTADQAKGVYALGQKVSLIITGETDIGFKAVVDGKYIGVLYADEVFQTLHLGQTVVGYIKKLRDDGKIDLTLNMPGLKAADEIAPKIMALLEEEGGYLDITDKTSPDVIYDLFGVSKKKYKIALGGLYKKRLITVKDDGIYLISSQVKKK